MADFETQIKESQAQVSAAQSKISEITSKIEAARAKLDAGEVAVDIENATLEDVHQHTDLMNANIAELIMGLDDVTAGFSKDFEEMRSKTGMESFIGIFSGAKSESMRQERMRTASIDTKLQDLIGKSDIIVKLLQGQLDLLNEQKAKVESNLGTTLTDREAAVHSLEAVRAEIAALDPRIIELENKISVEQDAGARTKLETELATLNGRYNAMVQDEQVQLAKSQTLERYIEKGKTWVDSLTNQAATQLVLINKLQTDTKQRVVLYDALSSSLKTAQQQDVAHRINEIGVKTDQEAQAAMAEAKSDPASEAKAKAANDAAGDAIVAYIKTQHLSATGLTVTFDGASSSVAVYGVAPDQATREKIVLCAGNVAGVASVKDMMSVDKSEPEAQYYTVKSGDTLSKIAEEFYGDKMLYPQIFEANRDQLKDPNKIKVGQKLRIP